MKFVQKQQTTNNKQQRTKERNLVEQASLDIRRVPRWC